MPAPLPGCPLLLQALKRFGMDGLAREAQAALRRLLYD